MTFLAGHGEICPQRADPYGHGAFLKKTTQEIHVDRAGLEVAPRGSPMWGGQISPWPARKVAGLKRSRQRVKRCLKN